MGDGRRSEECIRLLGKEQRDDNDGVEEVWEHHDGGRLGVDNDVELVN